MSAAAPRASLGSLERNGRKVGPDPGCVGTGQCPAQYLRVSANEEIRQRDPRRILAGLTRSAVEILTIRPRADLCSRGRHVDNLDSPCANAICCSRRVALTHTQLGQTYRVDGRPLSGYGPSDRLSSPDMIRRAALRSVNGYVRIEKHHGSRVRCRSCPHVSAGVKGACAIASRHATRLVSGVSSGRCKRTRTYRSSPSRCTSNTSPGLAPGMTMRFFASARTAVMGGIIPPIRSPSTHGQALFPVPGRWELGLTCGHSHRNTGVDSEGTPSGARRSGIPIAPWPVPGTPPTDPRRPRCRARRPCPRARPP